MLLLIVLPVVFVAAGWLVVDMIRHSPIVKAARLIGRLDELDRAAAADSGYNAQRAAAPLTRPDVQSRRSGV